MSDIQRPEGNFSRTETAAPVTPTTYGYGYGSNILAPAQSHLLDYVRMLHRRRWLLFTAFFVVFVSAAIYTFTATPMFDGRVQLLIERENPNVVSFEEVLQQDNTNDDYYQTQYRILQSRTLARRTIDSLNLWTDPRFNPPPSSIDMAKAAVIGGVRSLFASKPAPGAGQEESAAQSRVIDKFISAVTIAPVRNSRLVDLRFESPFPELAAEVANRLASEYISQNLDAKYRSTKEASTWLGGQLDEQRQRVEASERALQQYRELNDAIALEDRQNIVVQKLTDLNAAVTKAKMARIEKESAYNQIRAVQDDAAALDAIPAIVSNAFIQVQRNQLAELERKQVQLSEKFLEKHPQMETVAREIDDAKARIRAEVAKVVQSLRNEYLAAQGQEQSLTAALDQQKRDAMALNSKAIDYGTLQREAVSNRQIFDVLMQRTKETGISAELKTSSISIVDPAEVPRRAARPNRLSNLVMGLLAGLTFGIGLVFFVEYLDNRIKSPEEMKTHLRLPFLGMIPALNNPVGEPVLYGSVSANFVESFRALRTNVLFSSAEEGARLLLITSTAPGEGKTMVASNVAVALAQAGLRVLLIDADMRRPKVHEVFESAAEPGLSDALVGSSSINDGFRKTPVKTLVVLPAGRRPPNPAELLGSKRFKQLLDSVKEHFDWIVIDSPPVMAVTDAVVMSRLVDSVMFVVGADMTSRDAAQRAIEQLESVKARFAGGVLNRVDLTREAYYYSRYYRQEYATYYTNPQTAPTA